MSGVANARSSSGISSSESDRRLHSKGEVEESGSMAFLVESDTQLLLGRRTATGAGSDLGEEEGRGGGGKRDSESVGHSGEEKEEGEESKREQEHRLPQVEDGGRLPGSVESTGHGHSFGIGSERQVSSGSSGGGDFDDVDGEGEGG